MPNCTAMRANGSFCDRPTLPNAPFPICMKHTSRLLEFIDDRVAEQGSVQQVARQVMAQDNPDVQPPTPIKATWRGTPVVYYLQVGKYIKVGYSANLAERLRAYPPDAELLAMEPGSRLVESKRLKQFSSYRSAAREWHEPGPLLLQHIKSLQLAAA